MRHGNKMVIAAGVILLVVLGVVGVVANGHNNSNPANPTKVDTTSSDTSGLFVDPAKVPLNLCTKLVAKFGGKLKTLDDGTKTPVFNVGSTHFVGHGKGERLWANAPNAPLTEPYTLQHEQAKICSDPGQAAMEINGLGTQSVDGSTIAAINADWAFAQGDPKTVIDRWVNHCLTNDLDVHLQCAKKMSYVAALVGKFDSGKPIVAHTEWNYHVDGAKVGKVPNYFLDRKAQDQYTGWFIPLNYTLKAKGCSFGYGVNVGVKTLNGGDQRLAKLVDCKPTPKPHGCTSNCGGCTSNCGGCTSNCGCTSHCGCKTNCGGCKTNCSSPSPSPKPCNKCVTPTQASQPVPTPAPEPSGWKVSTPPSPQPTLSANPTNLPTSRPGGYNGGSPSQPGTTAPPTWAPPSAPPNMGDPGDW